MELPVEQILCNVLWVLSPPGTTMIGVLNSGADIPRPADAKHPFVIDVDAEVMPQIVVYASVSLVWVFHMDPLYLLRQFFVLCCPGTYPSARPFMVGGTRHTEQFAGFFNGITLLHMALLYSRIQLSLPYLKKTSLLSISSNFFRVCSHKENMIN